MPTVDDIIRTVTIQGSAPGVDDATASLQKLADAQGAVATVSDTANKSALSVEAAYQRQTLSVDAAAKSANNIANASKIANAALAQGIITETEHAARIDLINQKYGQSSTLSQAFAASIGNVQSQMVALSAGMGPVGVFMSSFGPWGLAAAAGLGIVTSAIEYTISEANRMGDVAQQLRDVSESTGLTVENLQQLESAGAAVGLSSNQVTQAFGRFEVQLGTLRDGSGQLYTDLMRINPTLVTQMASTKDAATAWNFLAQAYAQADQQQQFLIAHAAAGGRGGAAGAGNLLGSTAAAGGIQNLPAPPDLLGTAQVDSLAKLKEQIDATNTSARNLLASIGSPAILSAEKQAADGYLAMAQGLKAIADQQSGMTWFEKYLDEVSRAQFGEAGLQYPSSSASPGSTAITIPRQRPAEGYNNSNPFDSGGFNAAGSMATMNAAYKDRISLLGDAATATEKYQERVNDLNLALARGLISQQEYAAGSSAASLDKSISVTQSYVSALGPLATVQDQVGVKMLELQKLQLTGIPITDTQKQAIKDITTANGDWSKANEYSAAGAFNFQLANKAATDQVKAWDATLDAAGVERWASAQDVATAKVTALKAAAFDATPALKALHDAQFQQSTMFMSSGDLAAANAAKGIDPTNWTAHLNDAGPQLAAFNANLKMSSDLAGDFANNFGQAMLQGKTTTEALNSAIQSFESSLIQMATKNLVNNAFGSLLSAFHIGPATGSSSSLATWNPSSSAGALFANGGIMTSSGPMSLPFRTYSSGGVANTPQVAIYGEGGMNEAYVPLPDGRSIPVNINAGQGGGMQVVNNIYIENDGNSQVTQTQSSNSTGGTDTRITFAAMANQAVGSGSLDKVMGQRYGVKPVGQQR